MPFNVVMIAVRRCGLAALIAASLPVAAQQSIQLSKPADQDPVAVANAFRPAAPHASPGALNAPNSFFGNGDGPVLPPSPPPVMWDPNSAQWQKVLQERKNWSLMTPEQILGVPTPESILGIVDPQEDPKLSPEQRYLQRQDRQMQMGVSNALMKANAFLWQNENAASGFSPGADGNNVFGDIPNGSTKNQTIPGRDRASSPFFNPSPRVPGNVVADRMDSPWASAFDSPAPMPAAASPEQLAGMDRFRALMEPPPPEPGAASSTFSAPPAPTPDPFLQALPADFNPNGRAATAIQSDFGKPMGIAPLPGLTGPIPVAAKPAPLLQTPPWMSQTPKPGTLQQRQF